jgi:hypothetical protein
MKIVGGVGTGVIRVGSLVALGIAVLWGGIVQANPAQDAQEATPTNLKVNRKIETTDYVAGSLRRTSCQQGWRIERKRASCRGPHLRKGKKIREEGTEFRFIPPI